MYRTLVPPIKCQGIKTQLVPWIRAIAPTELQGRWIEPFMGSGVVAFNIRPKRALLGDTNPHLINFYKSIQDGVITPESARHFLQEEGKKLEENDGEYYYEVRDRFNKDGNPLDFLFLNRACFNGMIRFNSKGKFNVPFCRKPNRFAPAYITKICNQIRWLRDLLLLGDYTFVCQDFTETINLAGYNDLIYCDPPYMARHTDYFNEWNQKEEYELADMLKRHKGKFILSTWHSNQYRTNQYLDQLWSDLHILTREHFYHVGASEKNRNAMLEAIVTNYNVSLVEETVKKPEQMMLLEKSRNWMLTNSC